MCVCECGGVSVCACTYVYGTLPCTTPRPLQVYECLKRAPWNLVAGDFVRAEARAGAGQRRPLKKTDVVADGTVLRVFTNKKSQWQRK